MKKFFITLFIAFCTFLTLDLGNVVRAEDFSDLKVESFTFNPNTRKPTLKVLNIGNAAVTAWATTGLAAQIMYYSSANRESGTFITPAHNKSISKSNLPVPFPANDSLELTFDQAIPEGAVAYQVSINTSGNQPSDKIVGNNVSVGTVPRPDIAVETVTFDPVTRKPSVKISNVGQVAVTGWGDSDIRLFIISEGQARSKAISGLTMPFMPGDTATITFDEPVPTDASAYEVEIIVDYMTPSETEGSDSNNRLSGNVPSLEEVRQEIQENLQYPIAELGNCANQEDCRAYCNQSENLEACAAFGLSSGLLTEEEAQAAEDMSDIEDGPGGCNTRESCALFCEAPANINACLNYAERNNWMSADDLAKARKVAKILKDGDATPGGCNTPGGCKTYCSDNTHAVECVAFGKSAGLLTKEEVEEAEKIAPLMQSGAMPGGGKTREETEAYCDKEENRAECDAFFERAGVKKGSATSTIFEGKEDGSPGGCKTKEECDAYCDAHPGECDEAVIKAGGEVKEATALCSTNEDCRVFCQDPANAEACKNIVIEESPEEAEASKPEVINAEIEKLRQNILEMPVQGQDCVKQAWGAESFDRVMAGQAPETPVKAETLQSCYSGGVIKAGEEAAKKPEGQEEKDAAVQNLGGSLLDVILKWLRK